MRAWFYMAGHKGAADLAEVGEQLQEDALDEVLLRCEAISTNLRALLGEQRMADRQAPCCCRQHGQQGCPAQRRIAGLHDDF